MTLLLRSCTQILVFWLIVSTSLNGETLPFYRGADLSSLAELEADDVQFLDQGAADNAINILKSRGVNSVRLRLWHTPEEPWNGLSQTVEMAQRVKAAGLHLLLDIHYSDWWADPGSQTPPAAWNGLTVDQMTDSTYAYTSTVMTAFLNANVLPDMVQVGNEIGCGMLWPFGAICGADDTPEQWQQLAGFLNAGIDAIHDVGGDSIQIMIHDFRGGEALGARWFFSQLTEYGVEFDIIGLSYYPWWHGSLSDLAANMGSLAYYEGKPVIVVETAYPWTLGWIDNTNNIIGSEEQLLPDYPATPSGQENFLEDLLDRVEDTWGELGLGVYYWEPAWTSGGEAGSPWENLALFDFDGNALPGMNAFGDPLSIQEHASMPRDIAVTIYPNPANSESHIQFKLGAGGKSSWQVFNLKGALLYSAQVRGRPDELIHQTWQHSLGGGLQAPSGVYLLRVEGDDKIQTSRILVLN